MTISGGEPLLHPDLGKLVEYLCTYGDRIGLLEFITNGTMIPKTDVIYAMQKFGKVKVIIDNYGPELSTEVPQIEKFWIIMGFITKQENTTEIMHITTVG